MPRTKSAAPAAVSKRTRSPKKPALRTIHPKKKTKSILVDVIEDEPVDDSLFLSSFDDEPDKAGGKAGDWKENKSERSDLPEAIDRQKEFFSGLASEMKEEEGQAEPDPKRGKGRKAGRSLGLYRRLVIKFVALVLILAAIVAYFSFSKLTVAISLKGESINDNLLLKVVDQASATDIASSTAGLIDENDPRETVSGLVKEIETSVEKAYQATGETYLGEEIIGEVRIINNYNKSQALVATTRLLSPDNKLFRLKNAVNVPAGGEVTVSIYADKPAANLAIGPTTFTIPGLWLGLQDKIYAKSDAKFVYTQKVQKYVNVSDLERATADITDTLLKTAKEQASVGLSADDSWLYLADEAPIVSLSAKKGSQQEQFTAQAKGKVIAVSFNKEQASRLAAAKLNLIIPDDKELTEFNPEEIIYSLENYDPATKTATVKAIFNGVMILKSDAEVINPQQLVNLTAEQIATYLKAQPEIKDYSLNFSPSFIKKAPSLVDRIKILIRKD
ncbi:MAG: hypothetical protein WC456_03630 [Patescibacteria group bacterium]